MISIGFGGIRTDPTSTSLKSYRQVKIFNQGYFSKNIKLYAIVALYRATAN